MRSVLFLISVLFTPNLISAPPLYRIVDRYPIPGTGGWDYVTLDAAARRLYVSHATQVDVMDPDTGKLIGTIPDTPGIHGIAIASPFHHGFTSNGREDKVSMFDPATLKLIKKIEVGKGPDGIFFDSESKRVFTNNHGTHDITAIDADTGSVVGTVKVSGDGEQTVSGPDGLLYVNLEDNAEVVAYDPKSLEVKHRFPIRVAKTPTGLAYDAKTDRLFVACREKPTLVVMDARSGKVITSFAIGQGVDWADFDSDTGRVLTSNGDGTLSVIQQKSADVYESLGNAPTQPSAKTMAIDPKTHKIFLPAAEIVTTPAKDPSARPQRSVKPGTFVVLVLAGE